MKKLINKKIYIFCICTRNRNEQLINAIRSIKALKKKNTYIIKILIIENNLHSNLKKLKKKFPKIKIVLEKKIGISFARNKALKEILKLKFDYLCFFDDDCILDKYWLINNEKFLTQHKTDIVTGPHISKNNIYLNITERNFYHAQKIKWASTNNVLISRKTINRKNSFSTKLQNYGGEDQLFFLKLHLSGHKILWNKYSKVYDYSQKNRVSSQWFFDRAKGHGACTVLIHKEIHGIFYAYLFCIIKIFYDTTLGMICLVKSFFFKKFMMLKFFYYFNRAYGNLLSLFFIRKKRY